MSCHLSSRTCTTIITTTTTRRAYVNRQPQHGVKRARQRAHMNVHSSLWACTNACVQGTKRTHHDHSHNHDHSHDHSHGHGHTTATATLFTRTTTVPPRGVHSQWARPSTSPARATTSLARGSRSRSAALRRLPPRCRFPSHSSSRQSIIIASMSAA